MFILKKVCRIVLMFLISWHVVSVKAQYYQALNQKRDTTKKNLITGHPILGYTPETNFAFGAAAIILFNHNENIKNNSLSSINPFFIYTLNKQVKFVTLGDFYKKKYFLNFRLDISKYPQYFYGIGNNTDDERELYYLGGVGLSIKYLPRIAESIYLGGYLIAGHNSTYKFAENGELRDLDLAGKGEHYISGLGPSLKIDKRNDRFYPVKGYQLDAQSIIYHRCCGSDCNYVNTEFTFTGYVSTTNELNTLAFLLKSQNIWGESAPFYFLNKLGGENRMRGINSFRFTDNLSAIFQTEYRRVLPYGFGFVLFGGFGDVANTYSDYSFNELKWNYGAGLRINLLSNKRYNFRIDWAKSNVTSHSIYVGIGEVF